MGARTGREYLDRLAGLGTTVLIGGETLTGGIPAHPAFRNLTRTYARVAPSRLMFSLAQKAK